MSECLPNQRDYVNVLCLGIIWEMSGNSANSRDNRGDIQESYSFVKISCPPIISDFKLGFAPGISDEGAKIRLKGYYEWKNSEKFLFPLPTGASIF